MELFVKDGKTFRTKFHTLILDYEIKPSIYDTVSTYTIRSDNLPLQADFVYDETNNFAGIVSGVEVNKKIATISVNQIHTMFSRKILYDPEVYEYNEAYLKHLIDIYYTDCTDDWYRTPYVTVNANTQTTGHISPTVEENTFSISSYMAKLRRLKNIFCFFSVSVNTLTVNIQVRSVPTRVVNFENPTYMITEQNFSKSMISKITSFCKETSEIKEWVLLADGSVVNNAPKKNRVDGEWTVLTIQQAVDVETAVNDEFATNYFSHNITFQCPKTEDFELYDNLKIKLNGKVFSSYVAQKRLRKGSNIQEIQCGELQVQYPYLKLI